MVVVVYTSGHGFGHAFRDIELIEELRRRRGGVSVVVRTSAPAWLFTGITTQHADVDTGVVQIDSLRLDEEETARQAARFYADFDRRADHEAAFLSHSGARVVVGDIPPLAFEAAFRAGIPSIALGNFTWDWIYSAYPAFDGLAPDVVPTISRAYARTTRALRLPMHGGFEAMTGRIRDVPFIARRATRTRDEIRRIAGISESRPVVLASFGGFGVDLPLDDVERRGKLTVLRPDRGIPDGLTYVDLIAAADVVVSKPGYGIISDCLANSAALLYTSRGRFAEYEVLVGEMPRVVRSRFLPQADLIGGRWEEAVAALLAQPLPVDVPPLDGAAVAAEEILAYV